MPRSLAIFATDRCSEYLCDRLATHFIIAPDGDTLPGGPTCADCASRTIAEYNAVLEPGWRASPGLIVDAELRNDPQPSSPPGPATLAPTVPDDPDCPFVIHAESILTRRRPR